MRITECNQLEEKLNVISVIWLGFDHDQAGFRKPIVAAYREAESKGLVKGAETTVPKAIERRLHKGKSTSHSHSIQFRDDNEAVLTTLIDLLVKECGYKAEPKTGTAAEKVEDFFGVSLRTFCDRFDDKKSKAAYGFLAFNDDQKPAPDHDYFDKNGFTLFHFNQEFTYDADAHKDFRADQRFFYNTGNAAAIWQKILEIDGYDKEEYCRQTLTTLLKSTEFEEAFSKNAIDVIVSLGGGGAPKKDKIILENCINLGIFDEYKRLVFKYIDVSTSMLQMSFEAWQKYKNALPYNNAAPVYIAGDFQRLNAYRKYVRGPDFGTYRDHDNVLFMLTGGTFGNINENEFFHSLNSVSLRGDMLILSVSCETDVKVNDVYTKTPIVHLVQNSVNELASKINEGRRKKISPDFSTIAERIGQPQKGDVDGIVPVELYCKVNGDNRDIVIHRHTNYCLDSLIEFIEGVKGDPKKPGHGWTHKKTVMETKKETFAQLLFIRK